MSKTRKLSTSTWVVLPVFNESKYLREVLAQVGQFTDQIIIVDDGSRDDSPAIATEYSQHVLVHEVNLGKGAALKTGCEYAFNHLNAKQVVVMDSDAQHHADELLLFENRLQNGAEVVLGVRQLNQKMPLLRRLGNRSLSWTLRLLFGTYIPDILSGYRAFTKEAYQKIKWNSPRYSVETEMAARLATSGLAFETITITTTYHEFDRGMTLLDAVELYWQLLSWRFFL